MMLTAEGQVKVMDFGLAQLSDGSRLTQSDTVLGTPAYMSPEQALGQIGLAAAVYDVLERHSCLPV
jgi:serine/threonine protein kinase